MTRIAAISDTHLCASAKLPDQLLTGLGDVDLILHAGDLVDLAVLEQLNKIGPRVYAVWGNMDPPDVKRALPEKEIIQIKQFRIGLTHGAGTPFNLLRSVKEKFGNEKLNCIVYGHSHSAHNELRQGTLYFNPGSPTDRFFAAYNSYGILEINAGIRGKIIELKR